LSPDFFKHQWLLGIFDALNQRSNFRNSITPLLAMVSTGRLTDELLTSTIPKENPSVSDSNGFGENVNH